MRPNNACELFSWLIMTWYWTEGLKLWEHLIIFRILILRTGTVYRYTVFLSYLMPQLHFKFSATCNITNKPLTETRWMSECQSRWLVDDWLTDWMLLQRPHQALGRRRSAAQNIAAARLRQTLSSPRCLQGQQPQSCFTDILLVHTVVPQRT